MKKFCAGIVVGLVLSVVTNALAQGGYFSVSRYLSLDDAAKSAYVAGIADFVEYQVYWTSQFPRVQWGWLSPCTGEFTSGQSEQSLVKLFDRYIDGKREIRELAASSQFVLAVAGACDKAPEYWRAAGQARER